jgi:hypothetical protein
MGVITVEYSAKVRVEIFTDDDNEALTEARQFLHLANEEWPGIGLDGIGYEMNISVDPNGQGTIVHRELDEDTTPDFFSELASGAIQPGETFEDVHGGRWSFLQVYPLTKNATFVSHETGDPALFTKEELNEATGLRLVDDTNYPAATVYGVNEAAFYEARNAGLSVEDSVKAARYPKG